MNRINERGFTMMEVLIVMVIVAFLILMVLVNLQAQLMKARDSQRKTDLHNIAKSFEEYFNDKQCYPYEKILERCGSNELSPYQNRVPCDPTTRKPYVYVPGAPSLCSGYRICAALENKKDPDIVSIGCDPIDGCGWAPGYNFCLSQGYDVANTGGNAGTAGNIGGPTNTPTPTPVPGNFACSPSGACNSYGNAAAAGCPYTYSTSNCVYLGVDQCQFQSNRCAN